MTFGSRALVRLDAIRKNVSVIRKSAPDARLMGAIKANAYGHGMLAVARCLDDVDALAVARLSEAIRLRESGVAKPIVLLSGVTNSNQLDEALEKKLQIVVHCSEQVDLLENKSDGDVVVWLKIDTGMNRLGFSPVQTPTIVERLRNCSSVDELRLMTHLSSADELGNAVTRNQFAEFRSVVDGFDGPVSIANSPGILGWPQLACAQETFGFKGDHWIRPGLALYGVSPFAGRTARDLGLLPAMQFEASVIAVKPLPKGARVGYQGRYQAENDTMLGILAAGYGDGYSRHLRTGTPVVLNGRRAPLIGNVSMDMTAVDLGRGATDRVGDIATLWGIDLPVEEIATWADAIPYDLICGVTHREPPEYVDSER